MSDPDRLAEIKRLREPCQTCDHGWDDGLCTCSDFPSPEQVDWLVGEVERLRKFPAVWAVQNDNEYGYPEVIALYDNERAARAHAAMSVDPLEVEEMEVRGVPPRLSGGPLES
jgi:hypothetical protein